MQQKTKDYILVATFVTASISAIVNAEKMHWWTWTLISGFVSGFVASYAWKAWCRIRESTKSVSLRAINREAFDFIDGLFLQTSANNDQTTKVVEKWWRSCRQRIVDANYSGELSDCKSTLLELTRI